MADFNTNNKQSQNVEIDRNSRAILKKAVNKSDKSFYDIFIENKSFFYSVLFYCAGLLCGSFLYQKCQTDTLNNLISANASNDFTSIFINNLGLYFFAFAVVLLLGICLVGFPVINIVSFFIGVYAGVNIAYYYINYSIKGFGYNLLMIAPFICSFFTVIVYAISLSYDLSKKIYNLTIAKSDKQEKIAYKAYLKKYALYAIALIIVALINAAVVAALSGLVSL